MDATGNQHHIPTDPTLTVYTNTYQSEKYDNSRVASRLFLEQAPTNCEALIVNGLCKT